MSSALRAPPGRPTVTIKVRPRWPINTEVCHKRPRPQYSSVEGPAGGHYVVLRVIAAGGIAPVALTDDPACGHMSHRLAYISSAVAAETARRFCS